MAGVRISIGSPISLESSALARWSELRGCLNELYVHVSCSVGAKFHPLSVTT